MQGDQRERMFEGREAKRSSVYIAGILSSAARSGPAKIRNLSINGALVEVPDVPSQGSSVRLARGSLVADGTVIWASRGRCGIQFHSPVTVSEWVTLAASSEQTRIDQTVACLKNGRGHVYEAPQPMPADAVKKSSVEPQAIAQDLREMGLLIHQIGLAIMKEEILIRSHGATLQNIDIVVQTLDVVARLLGGGSPDNDARERLSGLRVSRGEALGRQR